MTGGIERLNIYYFVSFTFGDTITHVDLVIKTKLPMLIWSLLSNLPTLWNASMNLLECRIT